MPIRKMRLAAVTSMKDGKAAARTPQKKHVCSLQLDVKPSTVCTMRIGNVMQSILAFPARMQKSRIRPCAPASVRAKSPIHKRQKKSRLPWGGGYIKNGLNRDMMF